MSDIVTELSFSPWKQKHSLPSCKRNLQINFDEVERNEERNFRLENKDSKINLLAYPRCSTCSLKAPGRLIRFATSFCEACKIYLCLSCARKHRASRDTDLIIGTSEKTNHHRLIQSVQNEHQDLCNNGHKDVTKYFCKTCQHLVCLDCVQTQHKKHNFLYTSDACQEQKNILKKEIVKAQLESERILQQLDREVTIMKQLKDEKDKIIEKITTQTNMIIDALKARKKIMIQNLEKICDENEVASMKSRLRLQNRHELIKRFCHLSEKALNDNDEGRFLLFEKYAVARFQHLLCLDNIPANEESHYYYMVNCCSTEDAVKSLLGEIKCSPIEPSQCEASGTGIRRAVIGQENKFLVHTKRQDGVTLNSGRDDVRVHISVAHRDKIDASVTDNDNGTYTVAYTPQVKEVLTISVRIYGDKIKTPDREILPVHKRDYQTIENKLLSINQVTVASKEMCFKLPCGVAVDNQGRIVVADSHNHCITILSRSGNFIKAFGCFGSRNGEFNNPTDIAVSDDRIFVCDKDNNRIQCFNSNGIFVEKFYSEESKLRRPWGICIDSMKNLVIADTKNNQIKVFNLDGRLIKRFGQEGSGNGEFRQPYFLTAHSNGRIYVTDNGNNRVQVFDSDYSYLFQFNGDDQVLNSPTGITADHEGRVIVADECNGRLVVFSPDGKREAIISRPLQSSQCPSYPKGIAVTLDGYIVVADSDNDRLVVI